MTTPETPLVRLVHLRRAKICSRGARAFFRKHDMDWDRFLREGLGADKFEATGDCMARKVAEDARHGG